MGEVKMTVTLALTVLSASTIFTTVSVLRRYNKKLLLLESLTDQFIEELSEFQNNMDQWAYDIRFSEIVEDLDDYDK